MDISVAVSTNHYLWNDVIVKIQEVARAVEAEHASLASRVKELEVELSVWKQAHATSRDAAERQIKARDEQLHAMKQPNGGPSITYEKSLILCIIDGTKTIFSPAYFKQGEEGGQQAAEELTRGIQQHLADDKDIGPQGFSLWTSLYINERELTDDMVSNGHCTAAQFERFCVGLSQTSSLTIVDVANKKGVDVKIKEYIKTFAGLPQTLRVIYCGGSSVDLACVVDSLEAAFASSKLISIQGHGGMFSMGALSSTIPTIVLKGLFMRNSQIQSRDSTFAADESNWPVRSDKAIRKVPVIDPNLPLYKQNPPPCNEHYLLEQCSKADRCKYSHDYSLTAEQLSTLAKNAKQSPCWFLNNDKECPYGPHCCWGHTCPFGIKCQFSSRDKCRFKGAGMHRPKGDGTPSESTLSPTGWM